MVAVAHRTFRAFLIQLFGATSAAGNDTPRDKVLRGKAGSILTISI